MRLRLVVCLRISFLVLFLGLFAGSGFHAAARPPAGVLVTQQSPRAPKADFPAHRNQRSNAPEPYTFRSRDTVEVAAGEQYGSGPVKTFFLGEDYRTLWGTSIADIARDQTSSLNPYGAFIIPRLAQAAGVLHTAPTLVVIPDDPRLGEFREIFAGMLALLERKVDEDQSDAARFGHAKEVVDFETLIALVEEDSRNRVDERAYARARLFDMLIGDRDRHDGQWFWAVFAGGGGLRFVPLPIDRDFAFARFDGVMNWLGRKTGGIQLKKLTHFDGEIDNLLGLNYQGAKLDLRFTSGLTRRDWIEIADSIRLMITDEVIEEAVRGWPDAVYAKVGAETIASLKSRRDQLPEAAAAYYEMLADIVDIVGSDGSERFEVTRLNEEETLVVGYRLGDVPREFYRRTFRHSETAEVRLYGLGGDDQVFIGGAGEDGLRIRVVGGDGADTFIDRSRMDGAAGTSHFYDTERGNAWEVGPSARVHRSAGPAVNRYEMRRFESDTAAPLFAFDYDSDDGLFIGGGARIIRQGFRKEPYAAVHEIEGNYAPRSRAFNVRYAGDFVALWKNWNAEIEAEALAAENFRSFYGLGNETSGSEANRRRFNARLQWVRASSVLYRSIGPHTFLGAGLHSEYANIEPPEGWTEDDPRSGFTPEQFVDKYFAGTRSFFVVDRRDTLVNPRSGYRWANQASISFGVRNTGKRYGRLASELSYYHTFTLPRQVTLALRAGGATNIGDFTFYQANTLGGGENLRGYRTARFAGRSSLYTNAELRAHLLDFNIYLTKGELGLFGFFDNGRVWTDGEDSAVWHQGYGAGLWATPFNRLVLTGALAFSAEGTLFDLSAGFFF